MQKEGIKRYALKMAACLIGASLLTACGAKPKSEETKVVRTERAERLLANLKSQVDKGIMFGHHDDPMYGIGWVGDEERSDVKSV